jgi:hypothetical protein
LPARLQHIDDVLHEVFCCPRQSETFIEVPAREAESRFVSPAEKLLVAGLDGEVVPRGSLIRQPSHAGPSRANVPAVVEL